MMTQYTNKTEAWKQKRFEALHSLSIYWRLFRRPKVYVRKVYVYVYMNLFENVFLFFKWLTCLTAVKISFDYISCLVFFLGTLLADSLEI